MNFPFRFPEAINIDDDENINKKHTQGPPPTLRQKQ